MRDKKTLLRAFGEVVRDLRTERGITQDQLAELAQLTDRSHVSAIERAEKGPGLYTIFAIAEAFGVSPSQLIVLIEEKLRTL